MYLDLNNKRDRIQTIAMVLGTGVLGFFAAPFIFLTIKGIVGLAVAAALSFALIQFLPYFGLLIANWRLKAIKSEAAKNPIETLQNDFMARAAGLQKYRESLLAFKAEIGTFESHLEDFKDKFPNNATGIAKYQDQLNKMNVLFKMRGRKYQQAIDNLNKYNDEIERAKGDWAMAQASAQMNKAAGADGEQFLRNITVDTAFDSVQKGLNTAFAELEVSFLDETVQAEAAEKNVTSTANDSDVGSIKALPSSLRQYAIDIDASPVADESTADSEPVHKPAKQRARY